MTCGLLESFCTPCCMVSFHSMTAYLMSCLERLKLQSLYSQSEYNRLLIKLSFPACPNHCTLTQRLFSLAVYTSFANEQTSPNKLLVDQTRKASSPGKVVNKIHKPSTGRKIHQPEANGHAFLCTLVFSLNVLFCSDGRVSDNTKSLIGLLLMLDPQKRLTASGVLDFLRNTMTAW